MKHVLFLALVGAVASAVPDAPEAPPPEERAPAAEATRRADGHPEGDALKRVDQALRRYHSLWLRYRVSTTEPDGMVSRMVVEYRAAGRRRRVDIVAPADNRGMRILAIADAQGGRMYVFSPQLGKLRRVVSHSHDRKLYATAMQQGELVSQGFGDRYRLVAEERAGRTRRLSLRARSGAAEHPTATVYVDPSIGVPSRVDFHAASGRLARSETRSRYLCKGKACVPGTITVVDHAAGGQTTRLELEWARIDDAFDRAALTKRGLLH